MLSSCASGSTSKGDGRRLIDDWTAWETANRLRLPAATSNRRRVCSGSTSIRRRKLSSTLSEGWTGSQGPFVVVAAQPPALGASALPEIESKLRSLDVYSAWRLLPDLQIGIIHVNSDARLDKILALLSRTTTERVGVSARFDDLREAPQGLHVAKVTLRGRADNGSHVAVFDGSILATAAVSAPAVMHKAVRTLIDHFDDLGDEERELLFETFRVWQECDASMSATAEALVCHPNTVRYRLRRIEKRTGRLLSRPRDLAELCLAFEVQRRLM